MEVREVVTEYRVTAWPEDLDDEMDAYTLCVTVADRGHGKWAVLRGGSGAGVCLGADGEWDWEPTPSSREDDWLATHRFPLDQALALAREQAPKVTVNGWTALSRIEWHRNRARAEGET